MNLFNVNKIFQKFYKDSQMFSPLTEFRLLSFKFKIFRRTSRD